MEAIVEKRQSRRRSRNFFSFLSLQTHLPKAFSLLSLADPRQSAPLFDGQCTPRRGHLYPLLLLASLSGSLQTEKRERSKRRGKSSMSLPSPVSVAATATAAAAAAGAPTSPFQPIFPGPGARLGCGMHMCVDRERWSREGGERRRLMNEQRRRRLDEDDDAASHPLSTSTTTFNNKKQDLLPVHRPHPLVLELEDQRPGLVRRGPRGALCPRRGSGGLGRGEGDARETATVLPVRRQGERRRK